MSKFKPGTVGEKIMNYYFTDVLWQELNLLFCDGSGCPAVKVVFHFNRIVAKRRVFYRAHIISSAQ